MKQEQKPFEIKEEFRGMRVTDLLRILQRSTEGTDDNTLHFDNRDPLTMRDALHEALAHHADVALCTNAEIRRLRAKCAKTQQDFDTAVRLLQGQRTKIEQLTQQLADAPSWGEWQQDDWTPITNEEQVEGLPNGAYEFLYDSGACVLAVKGETPERKGWVMIGQIGLNSVSVDSWERDDYFVFVRVKSYKLIHAFEQPEKKYAFCTVGSRNIDGSFIDKKIEQTAREIAESGLFGMKELARDLLAAQARIRELEGKK